MRMNELIADVRADVAAKLFGDDLEQLIPNEMRVLASGPGENPT